jgi:hypothetical protein
MSGKRISRLGGKIVDTRYVIRVPFPPDMVQKDARHMTAIGIESLSTAAQRHAEGGNRMSVSAAARDAPRSDGGLA